MPKLAKGWINMGAIAKIAPKREGQEKGTEFEGLSFEDLAKSEERMALIIEKLKECNAECDRAMREAAELEKRMTQLHQDLMMQMDNLQDYIFHYTDYQRVNA